MRFSAVRTSSLVATTATVFCYLAQTSDAFQQRTLAGSSCIRTNTKLQVTVLEEWQVTDEGKVVGKIKGNPNYNDGDVVTTSPLVNPSGASEASFVRSLTGSEYLLGTPRGSNDDGILSGVSTRGDFVSDVLKVSGLVGLTALGFNLGRSSNGGGTPVAPTMMAATSSTTPAFDDSNMNIEIPKSAWTKTIPGGAIEQPTGPQPTGPQLTPSEVRDLFVLWNDALKTGNPDTVAMRYAKEAVLLPTKSDIPRSDYDGIRDYFVKFLEKRPVGKILESYVQSQPNYAMDVGIYEFAFQNGQRVRARYSFLYTKEDGEWKIKHHHSSGMPETPGQVISKDEVRQLFSLWNDALLSGNSYSVANRYAKNAVLLPTVSDRPRTDYDGIKDYFDGFLKIKPDGKIIDGYVSIGENWCKDVGIYEFTKGTDGSKVRARYSFVYVFEDGQWKISHHHSSLMPEELLAKANANKA